MLADVYDGSGAPDAPLRRRFDARRTKLHTAGRLHTQAHAGVVIEGSLPRAGPRTLGDAPDVCFALPHWHADL